MAHEAGVMIDVRVGGSLAIPAALLKSHIITTRHIRTLIRVMSSNEGESFFQSAQASVAR